MQSRLQVIITNPRGYSFSCVLYVLHVFVGLGYLFVLVDESFEKRSKVTYQYRTSN